MNQFFLFGGKVMRVFLIGVLLTACTVASDEVTAYCNGLTNDNTRVEIKLDINNTDGTVMVDEDSTFGFLVANKFNMYGKLGLAT